ncbi:hypothetical protein [uncultured Aureimonas sp.]|uniref:hypothetical protein n=1 Tax=uncultured Aureimonas sp. TaxID=1604662 RepID=UPI0025DDCDF7|nr:hypothetical protein [uncultured Aureimonas sp.]
MALTPDETGAGTRLAEGYNENDNTPANPLGLGRGAPRGAGGLFMAVLRDLALFGRGVVREVRLALAETERLAGEAAVAALLIEGGPVTSVQVGSGPKQTGAVNINIDNLSAEIEAEMNDFRTEMAAIATRSRSAIAYSLAFGG